MNVIKEFQGEYRWLSNFYPCPIEYDGIVYPSVENAYQALKCEDWLWRMNCAQLEPGQAKKEAKDNGFSYPSKGKKVQVMSDLLKIKFSQEPFRTKLLSTQGIMLEEGNLWHDRFWGVDLRTGKGENQLGKLLMELRANLQGKGIF